MLDDILEPKIKLVTKITGYKGIKDRKYKIYFEEVQSMKSEDSIPK